MLSHLVTFLKVQLRFVSFLLILMGLDLQARTICTITFNSPWEQLLFRTKLADSQTQFIELVPYVRDDQWLDKACKNPRAQCDMLIVSGHFAGEFFGVSDQQVEGYNNRGLTLSLLDLEAASCRADCEGIFKKPQDVFLLGCNTLAGKTPDGRSVAEYINVLLEDGFDLELAETIALTRYSHLGLTMAMY